MDGGGTDLSTGDTVALDTKSLEINKSVGCGALTLTAGTLTTDDTYTLTMDSGAGVTIGGNIACTGSLVPSATTTIHVDGTTTITGTGVLGKAATGYTLNMDGNLLASTGTLIAPNVSGTFTYSGATWITPSTFTAGTGAVIFDLAGTTTLGSDFTSACIIKVGTGTTFDTSAASNFALTISDYL
jgi:hypothetical protein